MEQAEPPGSPSRSHPPADLRRRALARAVDLLAAAAPLLLARNALAGALFSVALLLCGDQLFGAGRSLGKRLAGLRVIVLETGRPAGLRQSLARNALFVLAVVPVLASAPLQAAAAELCAVALLETFVALRPLAHDLGQRRLGDLLAGTQVIDAREALPLEQHLPRHAPGPTLASRAAREGTVVSLRPREPQGPPCASR